MGFFRREEDLSAEDIKALKALIRKEKLYL